jgi:hypothetical protein
MRRPLFLVAMALVLVLSACEEAPSVVCGDGRRQGAEICDGTDLGTTSCESLGYHEGEVRCSDACTLDVTGCLGRCGDGALDLGHEACEPTLPGEVTCRDLGYHGGELGCVDCQLDLRDCEARGWCGDGVLQDWENETCDGLALPEVECGVSWNPAPAVTCGPDCRLDLVGCSGFRRLGSVAWDGIYAVARDPYGDVYVAGETGATLPGQTHLGSADVLVARYGPDGVPRWTRQRGTGAVDWAEAVLPWLDDVVLVAGSTGGDLDGEPRVGSRDAFVTALDQDGNHLWTRLHGSVNDDRFTQLVGTPEGDVYAVGYAREAVDGEPSIGWNDVLVVKLTASGEPVWTRLFGTSQDDLGLGAAADGAGGLYVTGLTYGAFPGQTSGGGADAFLLRIDPDGSLRWVRQWGSTYTDVGRDVASLGQAAYVVGLTGEAGQLGVGQVMGGSGAGDVFVARWSADGDLDWILAAGTAGYDEGSAIAVEPAGHLFVAVTTYGHFLGGVNAGSADGNGFSGDVALMKLDLDGQLVWSRQLGGLGAEYVRALALDPAAEVVCVGGWSNGEVPGAGPVVGGWDGFLLQTPAWP